MGGVSGVPPAFGLLLLMEVGLPIPIPADLVMLFVGERVSSGHYTAWIAIVVLELIAIVGTVAAFAIVRGPGRALIARVGPRVGLTPERLARVDAVLQRRGKGALALSRGTPGLRTASVVAAGASGMSPRKALPWLIVGSTLFVEGHFLLGLALGSVARRFLAKATIVLVLFLIVLIAGGLFFWLRRRRDPKGGGGIEAFSEACCPACLALAAVTRLGD